MLRSVLLILSFTYFGLSGYNAKAQETSDEYSDYSYLWEDPKQKAKEEKRKAKEEKARLKALKKAGLLDTVTVPSVLPADSLPSTPTDSIQIPADTTQQTLPSDTVDLPVSQDTVKYPAEPLDSLEQEEIEEPKVKKEKKELKGPPVEDFRSGMGSSSGGAFNGGFTFTAIDGQYYAGLTLSPEFSIGKVGIGLNVPILYGLEDQKIRTEMFEDGVGVARLITYLRYGVQKRDPIYVKVGQLDNTMIGFGSLINNYTNTTSFEKRKVGLHYDFNIRGLIGVDGLYSDFNPGSLNLLAVRPYIRPMAWSSIPVVRTLEFGTTIIRDKDQTRIPTSDSTFTTYNFTRDGIGAFGIDAGLTLVRIPFLQIDLFAGYSKLNVSSQALEDSLAAYYLTNPQPETMANGFSDGSGVSAGLNFRFHFIADVFSTDARIERLSYTEHYAPQFFDAMYEINKDTRIFGLASAGKMSGIYGSLTGNILQKVQIGGSLLLPDNISETAPAVIRINADMDRLADKFSFHGTYIKGGLTDLNDAFTFDDRSLAKLRLIYHLNKFLAAGLDYFWAFTPAEDGSYKPTQYVSPYFGVSIAF